MMLGGGGGGGSQSDDVQEKADILTYICAARSDFLLAHKTQ